MPPARRSRPARSLTSSGASSPPGTTGSGRHCWSSSAFTSSSTRTPTATSAPIVRLTKLLELSDPRYLNLCLDTGHFAYYGGDNVKLIAAHPDRIGYLHLKQVDPELLAKVLKNDTAFADAARDVMVEPPAGIPDFAPIIEAVSAIDAQIFAIVEQDMPGVEIDLPLRHRHPYPQHIFGCTTLARAR